MPRSAKTAAWTQFLLKAGFDDAVARRWASRARPNVRLLTGEVMSVDTTATATTKLGGEPDLPRGTRWPERVAYAYTNRRGMEGGETAAPLDFLAQINLADVAQAGCDLPLPANGLLSFFYDAELQPWGFDPADAPGFRVIYTPQGGELSRLIHPSGVRPALPVKLEPGESLPDWAWFLEYEGEVLGEDDDAFHAAFDQLDDDQQYEMFYASHAFGGWPALIQNPMEIECQLASSGIYVGGPEGYADPRAQALEAGAKDWRLLLQLDSDDDLDWMWGDGGSLYFWCRQQDIAAGRFDRVWTVLQCT
jgi:uncharacterized protein YwqG